MKVTIEPGVYVVAVSGGVDSMVLLDLLSQKPELKLIVAHFDHGMRSDSAKDRELVQKQAAHYGLPFVFDEGHLGEGTSEEKARKARYDFLHKVRSSSQAKAIVTAHHQGDVLETAILNIMRGTNRKGLSSLGDTKDIRRPLLNFSKQEIIKYAKSKGLNWREDSTNKDIKYLRNYIRHKILPKLSSTQKQGLIKLVSKIKVTNDELDVQIAKLLQFEGQKMELNRKLFMSLPHAVAREVLAHWLRQNGIRNFDRKALERLVTTAKTLPAGKRADINNDYVLDVQKYVLVLKQRDR